MQNTWISQIQCLENAPRSHAYPGRLGSEERLSWHREAEMAKSEVRGQDRGSQSISDQRGRERSQKPSDEDGSEAREEERSHNRRIPENRDKKGCWSNIPRADFLPRPINNEVDVRCVVCVVQDERRYLVPAGHERGPGFDCLCVLQRGSSGQFWIIDWVSHTLCIG